MRVWVQAQRRCGSSQCDDTEARLMELCERDGLRLEDSEDEDEEEEVENSEPLEDSDIQYSDSGNTHTTYRGLGCRMIILTMILVLLTMRFIAIQIR